MSGHNHNPWCTCGWCTGGGNNYISVVSDYSYKLLEKKYKYPYNSYIDTNAHCPVCGKSVFFYQSPHGGKVFFDELGYPWTKHSCTDIKPKYKRKPKNKKLADKLTWKPYICNKNLTEERIFSVVYENEVLEFYIIDNSDIFIDEGNLIFLREINSNYTEAITFKDNIQEYSKRLILSTNKSLEIKFESIIMERYQRKINGYTVKCNTISKAYYISLIKDLELKENILVYIFFRFFDDTFLKEKIVQHPMCLKSGISDILEYIVKFGIKSFMDNLYDTYKHYEEEHIRLLKSLPNTPLLNGVKKIINTKENEISIEEKFKEKGWL